MVSAQSLTGVVTSRIDAAPAARALAPRRRRIVILTEDSKPALGGIAEYLHQLALATSATHDVLIVTSVPGADALNPGLPFRYREVAWYRAQHRWVGDGFVPLRRFNTVVWRLTQRRRVRALLAAIHAEQPDSSYVVGRLSPVTGPWSVACADLGLSYAVIGHGLELVEALSARGHRRRAARVAGAAHWFSNSHDTADRLAQYGVPPGRRSLLLPGVADIVDTPLETERRAVRERLGLGARRFLLSLCYLRRRKGIDVGIEAFAQLADEYPDLCYVVAGSGPEHDALRALARARGVGERVVFTGAIDDVTKTVLFAECEFFVLPNRATAHDVEGFGIVFLEASLHGKAVVGGANGGVPEAVADGVTGLLVDTRDAIGLREAERRLLRDPGYAAALGRQGRARARSEFSWSDRGRTFTRQLDALAGRAVVPSAVRARPTTPVVRVRQGMGRARNRLNFSLDTMTGLVRRGRLFTYFAHAAPPADRASCAQAIVAWIRRAIAAGGGEAASASYHIAHGWAGAYPEITGYLITTLLHYARVWEDRELADAAERAGNWLAETRLPGGAICQKQWYAGNDVPSVFNTAQVLEGWCALARAGRSGPMAHDWLALARESGDWLLREQDPAASGCGTRSTGFRTRITRGSPAPLVRLAEFDVRRPVRCGRAPRTRLGALAANAERVVSGRGIHGDRGTRPRTPSATSWRGWCNGGTLLDDPRYTEAADQAARALFRLYEHRGMLPGRFPRTGVRARAGGVSPGMRRSPSCGACWPDERATPSTGGGGRSRRVIAATVRVTTGLAGDLGGVQGSSPGWGDYDPFGYPTHAAKFTLDLFALLAA